MTVANFIVKTVVMSKALWSTLASTLPGALPTCAVCFVHSSIILKDILFASMANSLGVIPHACDGVVQALTVLRMVPKGLAPVRRAVSTTVRSAASPSAAHIAR